MFLQRQHTQHRGVTGGTNRHRLARREGPRQLHQPVTVEQRPLRQTAPMRFPHTPTVVHKFVTDLPCAMGGRTNGARTVDTRHHGPCPHHR